MNTKKEKLKKMYQPMVCIFLAKTMSWMTSIQLTPDLLLVPLQPRASRGLGTLHVGAQM